MYVDKPQYEAHTYLDGRLIGSLSVSGDHRNEAEMIELIRDEEPENWTHVDSVRCADLFYIDESAVVFVGTWVTMNGEAKWHSGGWKERPWSSKEQALRFLHERGRPA